MNVLIGELAFINRGICFYKDLIKSSLSCFAEIVDASVSATSLFSEEMNVVISGNLQEFESEELKIENESLEIDNEIQQIDFNIIHATGQDLCEEFMSDIKTEGEKIMVFFLPDKCRLPSCIGSNYGVVFSLFIGYMSKKVEAIVDLQELMPIIFGSIDITSHVYNHHRLIELLSLPEIISLLPRNVNLEIIQERNVLVNDLDDCLIEGKYGIDVFTVIIVNDHAVCSFYLNNHMFLVNLNGDIKLKVSYQSSITEFISCIIHIPDHTFCDSYSLRILIQGQTGDR